MRYILLIFFFSININLCYGQLGGGLCWQPPGLPVEFCINDKGKFNIKSSSSIVTPLGKFSIGANYKLSDNEVTYSKYYNQYTEKAVYHSPKIRYVEKLIEVPKYQYKLYLKYKDEIFVYSIRDNNELTIESEGKVKSTFKNSIVEVEISDDTKTKIIFNGSDTKNLKYADYSYPELKRDLGVAKFEYFRNKFLRDGYNHTSICSYSNDYINIPDREKFEEIITTVLEKNVLNEITKRKNDYYIKSDEDNVSRLVFTTYETIRPESYDNKLTRLDLYYNKSTFALLKKYGSGTQIPYKYFGINLEDLIKYLSSSGHDFEEDSVADVLSGEIYPGFSILRKSYRYLNKDYRIGLYSRFGNGVVDFFVLQKVYP